MVNKTNTTLFRAKWRLFIIFLGLTFLSYGIQSVKSDDSETHSHLHSIENTSDYSPLGMSLQGGWLDPWPHRHFSYRNTPYIHAFSLE